ncbi:MAG TPA: WD40 repeat domain-containing protein [Candidatus Babeliales bacterium]|nr:WD40 repeat domain-containing protein [Candidatus Babeliales bacterium]
MKRIVRISLLAHLFINGAYVDIYADVKIKLKNARSIYIPNEVFTKLRIYSPTINNIAQEIEETDINHQINELPLPDVDESLFRFVLDALNVIISEEKLGPKLLKYLELNGELQFKKLIAVIQYLDIHEIAAELKNLIKREEICFPAIKRKESIESEPLEKKLKADESFSLIMPASYNDRKPIINILKNSDVLKNSILVMNPKLKTIEAIDAGTEIKVAITKSQWDSLLDLAKKSDLSDEKNLSQVIVAEKISGKELLELIHISNYLDIPALMSSVQNVYLNSMFPSVVTQQDLNQALQSMAVFDDIPLDILEIFKNRIIREDLFKEFHWSGPIAIKTNEAVHALAFSSNGNTLAISLQQTATNTSSVMLFDFSTKTSRREVWASPAPTNLLFSEDGAFLVGTSNVSSRAIMVNLKNKEFPLRFIKKYSGCGAFSNTGSLFAYVNTGNKITIYNPITDQLQVLDRVIHEVASSIAFSPDDQFLAVGLITGEILIIDPRVKSDMKKMAIADKTIIRAISFLKENQILVKSFQEGVYIFDYQEGKQLKKASLGYREKEVLFWQTGVVWNDAVTKIVGDFYSELRIWGLPGFNDQQIIKLGTWEWPSWRGQSSATWLAFSKDGNRLGMIYKTGVLLWQNIDEQLKNLSFEQAYLIALLKKYQIDAKKEFIGTTQLPENVKSIIDSLPKDVKETVILKSSHVNN